MAATTGDGRGQPEAWAHDVDAPCPEEFQALLVRLFDSLPRPPREELIPLDECFASLGVDVEADDEDDPAAPTPD